MKTKIKIQSISAWSIGIALILTVVFVVISDLYLFGRDTWRNQCILCKDSGMGYHFAYNEWIFDGSHRVCTD